VWRLGLRYRVADQRLSGKPDIVFTTARVVVFCDGDFWHGRDLAARLLRLGKGHNAGYWVPRGHVELVPPIPDTPGSLVLTVLDDESQPGPG
jgi:DNA mismatch endonuclease Vsr